MSKKIICVLLFLALTVSSVAALAPPEINAKSAILIEKTTGEVLYEKNPDMKLNPASLTKIMTGIIALERGSHDSVVTVNQSALNGLPERNSAVYLIAGEEMDFLDMVRYLLIASGNDASNALAEHIAGSIDDFVALMNSKASELGMTGTHFANAHGLTEDGHLTTARDVAILSMYAMENEVFAQIVSETEVTLPVTNKHDKTTRKYTTNHLLSIQSKNGYRYEGALGIKTGSTSAAGLCLSAAFSKDNLTYYTVVMGAETAENGSMGSFTETIKLFNFARDNFSMQTMLKSTQPITEIPLRLAADKSNVILQPEYSVTALLPNDFKFEDLDIGFTAQDDGVDAPVIQGDELGELTVSYNGKQYASMALVAAESVERSEVLYIISVVTAFLSGTTFKIIVASVIALILLFIAYVILVNRRRRKKRQRYGGNRYK